MGTYEGIAEEDDRDFRDWVANYQSEGPEIALKNLLECLARFKAKYGDIDVGRGKKSDA